MAYQLPSARTRIMALRITTTRMMTTTSRWVVGQPRSEPTTASHYVPGTVSWLVPSPQQHHHQQHRYVHSKTQRAATRTHSYYHHQDTDNHDYEEEEDTHNPEPLPRPPNPASFSRYEAQYSYSQYARRDSRRRPSYHRRRHRPSSTALFPHSPEYAHQEGDDYYDGNDDYDYEEQEEEENNSYNDNDGYYGEDPDKDHHHQDWNDNHQNYPSYNNNNNNNNGEQRRPRRRQEQQQYSKQQPYSNPRSRDTRGGYEPNRSSLGPRNHQRRPENRERQSFVSQPEQSETNHNDNNPNLAWSSPQSSLTCPFTRGDKVMVEVTQFGPLGASVDIVAHASHNPQDMIATHEPPLAKGLIYQDEIRYFQQGRHNVPIVVGEVLPAYILKIKTEPPLQQEEPETEEQEQEPFGNGPQSSSNKNKKSKNDDTNDLNPVELDDYGRPIHPRHRRTFSTKRSYPLYSMTDDGFFKLDICLRIFGSQAKAESVATLVLELLHKRQSTTPERATIPIGDKSSPDEIARWFPGVSKLSFKRALSALYKQGKVEPGRHSVTLLEVDKEDGTHTHE